MPRWAPEVHSAAVCHGSDKSPTFVLPFCFFVYEVTVKATGSQDGEIEILNLFLFTSQAH